MDNLLNTQSILNQIISSKKGELDKIVIDLNDALSGLSLKELNLIHDKFVQSISDWVFQNKFNENTTRWVLNSKLNDLWLPSISNIIRKVTLWDENKPPLNESINNQTQTMWWEKLSNSIEIQWLKVPRIWFGLWTLWRDDSTKEILDAAILNGYRSFDTAQEYWNEHVLWSAIADSWISRDQFYITTKLSPSERQFPNRNISSKAVYESIVNTWWSLDNLNTKYVDLLLLHSPIKDKDCQKKVFDAFIRLRQEGIAKNIGVSNFNIEELKDARSYIKSETNWRLDIFCNQIEANVLLKDKTSMHQMIDYCKANDILVTAYSPLWSPIKDKDNPESINTNHILAAQAAQHNTSPANIALLYLLHKGVKIIPSSRSNSHQIENLNVLENQIHLTQLDIVLLDNAGTNEGRSKENIDYFNLWI